MPRRIAPPLALTAALALAGCAAPDDDGKRNIIGPVFFACDDGTLLTVRFDQDDDTARVIGRRALSVVLPRSRSTSGYWYDDSRYSLRGKGREVFWQEPGRAATRCVDRSGR
jgi:membrane-bound inhibitor of C-type lysozyme